MQPLGVRDHNARLFTFLGRDSLGGRGNLKGKNPATITCTIELRYQGALGISRGACKKGGRSWLQAGRGQGSPGGLPGGTGGWLGGNLRTYYVPLGVGVRREG